MNQTQYNILFTPQNISSMQLKNRIVMAPMGCGYAEEGGYIGQRFIEYYEARAKGGAGLIIIEATAPDMQCKGANQLTVADDSYSPGWQELITAIHRHGAKIALQLVHPGTETRNGETIQVSPSPAIVPTRMIGLSGNPPHELSIDEIKQIFGWFATAASNAKELGFDGVEIHGAHHYLIASFLSSSSNMRRDNYGGAIENKARFLIEVIRAMKEATGSGFPIWPRLNAQEYGIENGVTIEETKQVVRMATDAGADAIHASAFGAGSFSYRAPITDTPGFLAPLAGEIKKVTGVPVIAVGRINPEIGAQILAEGKADLIAMGRQLIADPGLPDKVAEGKLDDINRCIGCMECFERTRAPGEGVTCTINPAIGRESEYQIKAAGKKKRVAVIGGGPAGLTAARVAALRGHQVTLIEKGSQLGGKLRIAAVPPDKGDILLLINYLTTQAEKAGVEIKLRTEAKLELLKEIKPDSVVIATGTRPVIPDIPGINSLSVVQAKDILSGKVQAGEHVVIIGGGMVGCETGNFLAEQGGKVTIIEIEKRMANDMFPIVRRRLMDSLRKRQVSMITGATCQEIADGEVTITAAEGKKETLKAHTVVIAAGYDKEDSLMQKLKELSSEIYCIGDSSQPGRIMEAIHEGYQTGLSL